MDGLLPVKRARPDERTAGELEILTIWGGLTSQEIAVLLKIAPKTVESHRANLMRKFRASNAAQLLRIALTERMLHVPPSDGTAPPSTARGPYNTKWRGEALRSQMTPPAVERPQ